MKVNMTTHLIKYIFKYQKKDGTIRNIKTDQKIDISKPNHFLVWDCEKNDWRTLIRNKILEFKRYDRLITYKKCNNEERVLRGQIWKETNTHVLIWDEMCEGWRNLIKNRIMVDLQGVEQCYENLELFLQKNNLSFST